MTLHEARQVIEGRLGTTLTTGDRYPELSSIPPASQRHRNRNAAVASVDIGPNRKNRTRNSRRAQAASVRGNDRIREKRYKRRWA
jgi:hypothetical protein